MADESPPYVAPFYLTAPPSTFGLDLWDIADRHGLKPMRSGSRIRFFCAFCGDPSNRRKGRAASASASVEGNPWKCYRCSATGNARTLAAHLGEALQTDRPTPEPRRPRPQPKPKSPDGYLDTDAAWQEITAATGASAIDRVTSWATIERGWPGDVAQAVAYLDDVACPLPSEGGGRAGGKLVRAAHAVGRHLLIAIRCHEGKIRNVARRWAGDTPVAPQPKSLTLAGDMVGPPERWGGVWAYGSIPEAVQAAAAGEPIFIVEGGPDFLAGTGALAVAMEAGVVLGFYNTTTARGMTRALAQALGEANVIAPRVVLVPNMDPIRPGREHGYGMEAALQSADLLRGRAGVFLCELPLEGRPTMDVSDYLRAKGTADLVALLRTPRCLFQAPVPIAQAGAEMSARFQRAVIEATQRTSFDRRTVVVFQVPPGAGKSYNALKQAAAVACGAFPIPVNGPRPRGWPVDQPWPPLERSVIFATPDHPLAAEKLVELEELAPGTPARHLAGLLTHCHFADKVADVFPAVGRRGVCGDASDAEQRCPLALTCAGALDPSATRGEVTFVPHIMGGRMKADLVIIDESPGVVGTDVLEEAQITSLFACRLIPRVLRWRRIQNSDAGDAAKILADIVSPMARAHASEASSGQVDPYPRRIYGQELVDLLNRDPKLAGLLVAGYNKDAQQPPVPLPVEVRSGFQAYNVMPSRPAFNGLRALTDYYLRLTGPAPEPDPLRIDGLGEDGRPVEPPRPVCAIRLDTNGTWCLEIRRIQPLPKAPVVILDATGDLTLAEWQAAYPDRKVVMRSLEVQGAAPASAIHVKSLGGFTRKAMLDGGAFVREDAAPRILRVLDTLAEAARKARPRADGDPKIRLGLLTHKPVADALLDAGPAAKVGGGPRLRAHMLALQDRGFEFIAGDGANLVGWYGRHDRGTNAFQAVDGFAVIGDPVGNLGDIDADAFLLGLKPDDIAGARTAATCRQAIARARHIRRDATDRVVLMFAGKVPPEVPGVVWQAEELRDGVLADISTGHLTELCLHVARVQGCLGVPVVQRFPLAGTPWEALGMAQIPRARIQRTVKRVAKMLRWPERRISTGRAAVSMYAEAQEPADLWVATNLSMDEPEPPPPEEMPDPDAPDPNFEF